MTDSSQHQRGAPLECGKCRESLKWDPFKEVYICPKCRWVKE